MKLCHGLCYSLRSFTHKPRHDASRLKRMFYGRAIARTSCFKRNRAVLARLIYGESNIANNIEKEKKESNIYFKSNDKSHCLESVQFLSYFACKILRYRFIFKYFLEKILKP
jgi:hypothetical protein